MNRWMKSAICACGALFLFGCAQMGGYVDFAPGDGDPQGASSGGNSKDSLAKNDANESPTYVNVWLDGQEAQKSALRAAITDPVSIRPTLKYEITDPASFGKVKNVIVNVFREVNGSWSNNAAFIVMSANMNDPNGQLKPGVEYDLGSTSGILMIMDGGGQRISGLNLESGAKYLMNVVVSGDMNETVGVQFRTR